LRAAIITVGTEMLRFGRRDTNSEWLADQLGRIGVEVATRTVVPDDIVHIASTLGNCLGTVEIVLLTGGLGPTEDDRTREAVAESMGLALERDESMKLKLRERLEARGRKLSPLQDKQAERPAGAEWIENPLGTAPGFRAEGGATTVYALPGVPAEMKSMFLEELLPGLAASCGRGVLRRTLKVAGRTEPSVDEQLSDLYALPGATVTILSGSEGIELQIVCEGGDREEASRRLAEIDLLMSRRLGRDLYARDDGTLSEVVAELMLRRGESLATAESCTAGMLAAALTTVPGSSAWYRGGLVVYSDDLKESLAGVDGALIRRHGAVSEEVARELARGVRKRCDADHGIAITGIAGPAGGTAEKPVGLVHIALDDEAGTNHWRLLQFGDRQLVRRRSVTAALDGLRRRLLERSGL
jgi:nicotinamide-nucleotide amidase